MNAGWGHGACHALFLVVDEGEAEAIIGRLQLIRGLPHENVWCRVRTGCALDRTPTMRRMLVDSRSLPFLASFTKQNERDKSPCVNNRSI
jgi:hypothetical protein